MRNDTSPIRVSIIITVILALLCVNACSTVRLNTIPQPPPSAKLRVFVQVISGELQDRRYHYGIPPEEWAKVITIGVDRHLRNTGIYEVVPKKDIQAVLGKHTSGIEEYWWSRKDYALLRQAGRALHADYAMIITRSFTINITYKMLLINLETGTHYTVSETLLLTSSMKLNLERGTKLVHNMFRKLSYDAKGDLLATAIRKGRLMPTEEIKKPAAPETKLTLAPLQPPANQASEPPPISKTMPVLQPPEQEEKPELTKEPLKSKTSVEVAVPQASTSVKPPEVAAKQTVPDIKKDTETPKIIAKIPRATQPDLPDADKRKDFEAKLEDEFQDEAPVADKTRLVVYDFDTVERLNIVALILTDALREELFKLGNFSLVNRENIAQVMQERKLQQSGLVDEKQIVALGKWLAANEAVTGRLAVLGNSYFLQAKRTDIKTLGTLGLGSLKCTVGQEDDLLSGMPELARRLLGLKSNF